MSIYKIINIIKALGYLILAAWLGMQVCLHWIEAAGFEEIVNVSINERGMDYLNLKIPSYVLITTFFLAFLEFISNSLEISK